MTIPIPLAITIFFAVVALFAFSRADRNALLRRALAEHAADLERTRTEFADSTAGLRAQLSTAAALREELEHQNRSLDTKAAEAERRLSNTQTVIATVCKERDFWHQWYLTEVSDHGAAQHMLLSDIELHVKRGCKLPFSPQLSVIVEHYEEKHPAQAIQSAPEPTDTGAVSGIAPENRV